jgi:hypothetical protein
VYIKLEFNVQKLALTTLENVACSERITWGHGSSASDVAHHAVCSQTTQSLRDLNSGGEGLNGAEMDELELIVETLRAP